ncbi:lysophospholipid acyltransferase family protein [Termitidicoccus mucosus]|uniref:lysophospholipid acyltransferase family protein n=1 Tax=Termitidicoccus mucosus TaxID=1184151 RepID=UPI0026800C33
MIKLLIHATGWLVARTPHVLLRLLAGLLGRVILLIPKRRSLLFSNLHHAFPDRPRAWHAHVARLSCVRLIETGMLSLASPFFSETRIRRMARLSPELEAIMRARAAAGESRPLLIGTLHFAYWECLTWLGLLCPGIAGTGVIFRPLKNPVLNAWVKQTRERHGVLLLSRKNGLQDAFRIMRRGGIVSLLFDQNAGGNGALTLLLGRVCSTSELAGMLAEKFGAKVVVFYPRRLGFWTMRFEAVEIDSDGTSAGVTLALNRWLETLLSGDEEFRASWLWSHGRWRTQDAPWQRLRLEAKRDLLDADLAARGLTRATMPRRARFWITMPGDRDACAAALPLLRRLRRSRPDAEITLLAEAALAGPPATAGATPGTTAGATCNLMGYNLGAGAAADKVIFLPAPGPARRRLVRSLRNEFPDTHILLENSAGADREARLINAPQRFGLCAPGRRRPHLTHTWSPPPGDVSGDHPAPSQVRLWEQWWESLGLPREPELKPERDDGGWTYSGKHDST